MYGGIKIKRSVVTEGPEVEPIDITAAKSQLKIEAEETDEDSLIQSKIQTAREHVEDLSELSLITQTRVIKIDCFPYCDTIDLTHGPVQSVTSVQYYDEDDVLQPLDSALYWVHTSGTGSIQIKNSWPSTKTRNDAVVITYVAGFGDAASDVPMKLREAVQVTLTYMFENREQPIPANLVDALIGRHVRTQDVSY